MECSGGGGKVRHHLLGGATSSRGNRHRLTVRFRKGDRKAKRSVLCVTVSAEVPVRDWTFVTTVLPEPRYERLATKPHSCTTICTELCPLRIVVHHLFCPSAQRRRVTYTAFLYIQMTESTADSNLSTDNTEEKKPSLDDLQMTEFKFTEKEKQSSRVALWVLYTMLLDLYNCEYIVLSFWNQMTVQLLWDN